MPERDARRMAFQPDPAILAVFTFTALGVAAASLYAPTAGIALLWTAALVPWTGILLWRGAEPLWVAAVTAGLVAGVATGVLQAAFQGTFLANHPEDAASLGEATRAAIAMRFIGFAALAGTAWGLLSGGLAWLVRRVM